MQSHAKQGLSTSARAASTEAAQDDAAVPVLTTVPGGTTKPTALDAAHETGHAMAASEAAPAPAAAPPRISPNQAAETVMATQAAAAEAPVHQAAGLWTNAPTPAPAHAASAPKPAEPIADAAPVPAAAPQGPAAEAAAAPDLAPDPADAAPGPPAAAQGPAVEAVADPTIEPAGAAAAPGLAPAGGEPANAGVPEQPYWGLHPAVGAVLHAMAIAKPYLPPTWQPVCTPIHAHLYDKSCTCLCQVQLEQFMRLS